MNMDENKGSNLDDVVTDPTTEVTLPQHKVTLPPIDPLFRVEVLNKSPNPNTLIYQALHQDYSEGFVYDDVTPDENRCGEIAINRLLNGGRGHYGCYSADTEVLTIEGWKFWPDVTTEDKLLAVDYQNGKCNFEYPKRLQSVDFCESDTMYELKSQFLNFCVTNDHRMIVSHRTNQGGFSDWVVKTAAEVKGKPVRYLVNSCLDTESRYLPLDLPSAIDPSLAFKIAGFFFGDGMRTSNENPECLRFRLRRPRKIAYMKSWGIDIDEKKGDRYVVRNPSLSCWVHKHFSNENEKCIPKWLLTLPDWAVASFWDGLKNSDGTNITDKSWCYDSTAKDALDIIQATAHINGFNANITLNNPNIGVGHENHKPCWRLRISEHSTRRVETCHKNRSPGITEAQITYSGKVYCASVSTGALMVRREGKVFVCGNCLEHPQISFNVGWFPHSCMQQMRTHRTGISFDVQSFRYSGERIYDLAVLASNINFGNENQVTEFLPEIEEIFYIRPVGYYTDRQGKKYETSYDQREEDLLFCLHAARRYRDRINQGYSEEHARSTIPFDVRQHFVMSCNLRTVLHLLDLRAKENAQLECRQLCDLIIPHLREWVPEITEWYIKNRLGKARLSP